MPSTAQYLMLSGTLFAVGLMVLTAEPGTPSHERLRILASWNAEPPAGMGAQHRSATESDL